MCNIVLFGLNKKSESFDDDGASKKLSDFYNPIFSRYVQ